MIVKVQRERGMVVLRVQFWGRQLVGKAGVWIVNIGHYLLVEGDGTTVVQNRHTLEEFQAITDTLMPHIRMELKVKRTELLNNLEQNHNVQ